MEFKDVQSLWKAGRGTEIKWNFEPTVGEYWMISSIFVLAIYAIIMIFSLLLF